MAFIVMEYLEGETLAVRLRAGPLPLPLSLKIGVEIADALDKAHREGIIHRDLKPSNIMLTKSGAKLMDFGLAKSVAATFHGIPPGPILSQDDLPTMSKAAEPDASFTEHGAIVGTLLYMAPESIQGRPADFRSDIFSFGCVLYEMISGKRAFAGESRLSIVAAILEKEPQPMSSLQSLTPIALEHVVFRCLMKDPEERWQSSRDLSRELKWISGGVRLTKTRKAAPRRRERLAWGVAALCIALLTWLGLLIGAAYSRRRVGIFTFPYFRRPRLRSFPIISPSLPTAGGSPSWLPHWMAAPLCGFGPSPLELRSN